MKTIQAIKCLSIRDYLSQRGLHPAKDNPRYGLYLSPLRDERTPSFKVDYMQNLWYDFGLGTGGSIIDLVMRLERCDFTQAIRCSAMEIERLFPRPYRHRLHCQPSRFASSSTPRFGIRHWSAIFPRGESTRQSQQSTVGKCIMLLVDVSISLSDSATKPEDGNCVPNASRAVYPPSTLQQSTMVPIPLSHLRALWISSPSSR